MSEKQAVLPKLSEESIASRMQGWLLRALEQREYQLLTLLQSLADAGIEVKDGKVIVPKPARQALIDRIVGWRQEVGGSVSPYNHRRLLSTWSMADLQALHSKILSGEPLPVPPTDSTKEIRR